MSLTFALVKNLVGAMGNPGTAGAPGRTIYNSSGPPSAGTGVAGDFYLNTANTTLYGPKLSDTSWTNATIVSLIGPQGATGSAGTNGTNGTNGNTILNGTASPPANTVGNNGDFYLNTTTEVLYGPKAAGAWPSAGVSLIGPQGPSGTATLPNDITANSLVLAPVSGDTNPVQLRINNASGTQQSIIDSVGNFVTAGQVKGTILQASAAGSVSQPSVGTSAAGFYTNAAGTRFDVANNSLVQTLTNLGVSTPLTHTSQTPAGTPSYVSTQGFKAIGPTYYYWGGGNSTSANYVNLGMSVTSMIGTQTASFTAGAWTATRSGSVTGLSVAFDRANSLTFVFRLVIGGTTTAQLISTTGSTFVTFAKGTYPFTAGQTIQIQGGPTTASTPLAVIFANFEIELPA